jgi:hydrogenase maturation factor HypF (carbamoyltransferase family)
VTAVHAQPNACPDCARNWRFVLPRRVRTTDEPIAKAQVDSARSGGGDQGPRRFHLHATPRVKRLWRDCEIEAPPKQSFSEMFRDLATLKRYCEITEVEEAER